MDVQEQTKEIQYVDFEEMPMFTGDVPNIKLLKGILSYGFVEPSEIQGKGIVPMYEGHNLIAQSQSGTGKTGTFVIGSLSRLDASVNHVQIIVVAPTHELATQIHHVYCAIGKNLIDEKHIELCVGKQVAVEDNIRSIHSGAKVLVGTPGRILHLIKHKIRNEYLVQRKYVKTAILDEADKLLSDESKEEIIEIINRIDDASLRSDCLQINVFSATYNKEEAIYEARKLCLPKFDEMVQDGEQWQKCPNAPIEILLKPSDLTLEGIEQYSIELECEDERKSFDEKVAFIVALNQERMIPTCIIYANNGKTAERLHHDLNNNDMVCECIHGKMQSKQRLNITDRFRKGETRILVSTDLLARGFDVRQVSLVINFDLPYVYDRRTADLNQQKIADYLHRIGRSGRYGRKGVAINILATPTDASRMRTIEDFYGVKVQSLPDDVSTLY